jgi:hypothetical protein
MSHFAKIDENNIVTQVIVAEQAHIDTLSDSDKWIQTSYNTYAGKHYKPNGTPLRKNYAGIGFTYDSGRDAFIPPKPTGSVLHESYASWTLNEGTCRWEAPTSCPGDESDYVWNEDSQAWDGPFKEDNSL